MEFKQTFFKKKKTQEEMLSLLDWMRIDVERSEYIKEAKRVWDEIVRFSPTLQALRTTPQGAPFHAEGATVYDHVLRMLTALIAIQNGASIERIEGIGGTKRNLDIELLRQTICEHYATYVVFCLLHDIGKVDTVRIERVGIDSAQMRSFMQGLSLSRGELLSSYQKDQYHKLVESLYVRFGTERPEEIMIELYKMHGIEFSYHQHETWFVNDESIEPYKALIEHMRLTPRDIQQVKFLIRYHSYGMKLAHHRGHTVLSTISRVAEEFGLDAGDARNVWFGSVFLNDICGKIGFQNQNIVTHEILFHSFIQAEEHVFMDVRVKKQAYQKQLDRVRMKHALANAGLTMEDMLDMCKVPYTAEREKFVSGIYDFVSGKEDIRVSDILQQKETVLKEQLETARRIFDEQG